MADASVAGLDAHLNGSLFNFSGEPVKASHGREFSLGKVQKQ